MVVTSDPVAGVGKVDALNENSAQRFSLALFVIHPTLLSAHVSEMIGLEPHFAHDVGARRSTPAGKPLTGRYPDTRWRHCIEYASENQHFRAGLDDFLARLSGKEQQLAHLRESGGETVLVLSLLGDGHYGDNIRFPMLSQVVSLGLDLGIEAFVVPQK